MDDDAKLFTSQDTELWSVFESIQNKNDSLTSRNKVPVTGEERLKVFTDTEIEILEKGLDFDSIQRKWMNPNLEVTLRNFVEN